MRKIIVIIFLFFLTGHAYGQKVNWISFDEAVKSLQPPIFFKAEQAFKGQVSKWRGKKLEMVMGKLADLEAQTKTSGAPVQTLCAQAILSLSMMR